MMAETFHIKSLFIQNAIMASFLLIILLLFIRSWLKSKKNQMIAVFIWLLIGLWFFNSPFFGFSTVKVDRQGISLNYGFLSIRNKTLPLDSEWKVETYLSGIKRNKRLFYLSVAGCESMRVTLRDRERLDAIGEAIDRIRSKAPS